MTINAISRYDYDKNDDIKENENPNESLAAFLSKLSQDTSEVLHSIRERQIDIDHFLSEQGNTGQVDLTNLFRKPIKVTDVIAVWNAAAFPVASQTNTQAQGTFAAAGSGSAVLPVGATITGFIVTVAAGAAAVNTTISVTNGAGGTMTFDVSSPATGTSQFEINFPEPIPAASGAVAPTVTWNGVTNTGAGHITAFGFTTSTPAAPKVTIQIGQRLFFPTPSAGSFLLAGITGGIQVLMRDKCLFTVTPAVACHFELLGYGDYRKIDTP